MAVPTTARPTGSRPGIAAALHLVLRLLALLVFAQAVFAGLFLDGHAVAVGRPGWMALAGLALLVAVIVQSAMGQSGQVAVHVPLGVAILGLIGALLSRTRNLARASADPSAMP